MIPKALITSESSSGVDPQSPVPPAGRLAAERRTCLLAGLASASLLALAGCSVAPTRRNRGARAPGRPSQEEPAEEAEAGAAGPGSEIVMQALANVGKPYRWGGAHPTEGFDCSGLVAHVFEDALGMKLPRTSLKMSSTGTRVERARLSAGDLVFFNTSRYAYSHVGIYIGRGRFVHAPSSGSLVRVERMSTPYWSTRFDGARRLVAANAS